MSYGEILSAGRRLQDQHPSNRRTAVVRTRMPGGVKTPNRARIPPPLFCRIVQPSLRKRGERKEPTVRASFEAKSCFISFVVIIRVRKSITSLLFQFIYRAFVEIPPKHRCAVERAAGT
jgi:hypothetical protein